MLKEVSLSQIRLKIIIIKTTLSKTVTESNISLAHAAVMYNADKSKWEKYMRKQVQI